MNLLWAYFWPVAGCGLLVGTVAGLIAFRRGRIMLIAIGAAITLAIAGLWHGPLGAADEFAGKVERTTRASLDYYEMTQVSGRLQRAPISRNLRLEGPADDWQRGELVRLMSQIPGVRDATWSDRRGLPLLAEAAGAALAGFLIGVLLAYGVELRRRYNAQWKW